MLTQNQKEQLKNENVMILNIYCLELLLLHEALPNSFMGVFEKKKHLILEELNIANDFFNYPDVPYEDEVYALLMEKNLNGFLIEFSHPLKSENVHISKVMFAYGETLDATIENILLKCKENNEFELANN